MSKQAVLLDDGARQNLCSSCPNWTMAADGLEREWRFHSFVEAFGFMTQVALLAERANHHPEWSNTYSVVNVELQTHDCDGVSTKDHALADFMDYSAVRAAATPHYQSIMGQQLQKTPF